jgi:tetratricopeptide (TPR) repeat protein
VASAVVFLPAMRSTLLAAVLVALAGCRPHGTVNNPTFAASAEARDPIAVYEALEALIDAEKDTKADREDAYAVISSWEEETPAYAFARAAIAGRLAENRGLQAGGLVTEAEAYARKAREMEPDFREGSATRMLGTLYILAPSRLLKHGDSETGLEMLEEEVEAHPGRPVSRLRLAEGYIALGDPDPAKEHLCAAKAAESELGAGDRRLLAKLIEESGGVDALGCGAGGE